MASPTELDIFTRSLSGDRRARTELFKKFIRDSPRVGRLGVGYADHEEFLHDCFNNLLRTGYAWDKEGSLANWVTSVAVWTAMEHERQRDMGARSAKGEIRMCAEMEGQSPTYSAAHALAPLDSYAPPISGPDDSPARRIFGLLNETESAVFKIRAVEHGNWDQAAAAVSKPINAVGTIFTHAMDKVTRLFGAPPPMDDDLVPVFERAAVDKANPEGRSITLLLDPMFYVMTPEMHAIGLTTSHEVRTIVLWEAAQTSTPPSTELRRHLGKCHYCASLLRAMLRMQHALTAAPGSDFLLCPGSFTLAGGSDLQRNVLEQHLTTCPCCSGERTLALEGQVQRQANAGGEIAGKKKLAWGAAAVLVLGSGSFAGYRYFTAKDTAGVRKGSSFVASDAATVAPDPRYRDLIEDVPLDDTKVLASVLPQDRPAMKFALDQFSIGQPANALMVTSQIASKKSDPGAMMLYAMSLYRTQLISDGYREMLLAEAMPPRDPLRCWVMFEFALMVGERKVADREAEHLASDPQYKDRVKRVMEKVRKRG